MVKSLISRNIILVSLLFLLSIVSVKVSADAKVMWQDTNFNINLDGSIGIGFYNKPTGAIEGGLGLNLDIVFLNLKFINLGISGGILNITNSKTEGESSLTSTFPINVMFIKYIRQKGWETFSYIHLSPGAYLKTDFFFQENNTTDTSYTIIIPETTDTTATEDTTDTTDPNALELGIGFSTGFGFLISVNSNLFVNFDVRFHLFMVADNIYNILSNSIGITLNF